MELVKRKRMWKKGPNVIKRDKEKDGENLRQVLEQYMDGRVDPSADDNCLIKYIDYDHRFVKLLVNLPLSMGVDPSADDNYAIRHAVDIKIVKILCELPLERGVDPSANNNELLRKSCACDHYKIVEYLLSLDPSRGIDPSVNDNECLINACEEAEPYTIKLLLDLPLERGVDPGARNSEALSYAASNVNYSLDILQMLLSLPPERGVDASENNKYYAFLEAEEYFDGYVNHGFESPDRYPYLLNLPPLFDLFINHPRFYPKDGTSLPDNVQEIVDKWMAIKYPTTTKKPKPSYLE